MFVEQRLYTCAPGQTGEFLRVYEREGRAPQMQHLGQPVGYYISEIGTLNQVTTLWAYGSLDERVQNFADAKNKIDDGVSNLDLQFSKLASLRGDIEGVTSRLDRALDRPGFRRR